MVAIAIMLGMAMVLYHAHYRTCPVFDLVSNTSKSIDELIELFIGVGHLVCEWFQHMQRLRLAKRALL